MINKIQKLKWLPKDWKEFKLDEIIKQNRLGGNYKNSESATGLPLIKMGNLGRGKIVLDKIEYVDETEEIDNMDILKYGECLYPLLSQE